MANTTAARPASPPRATDSQADALSPPPADADESGTTSAGSVTRGDDLITADLIEAAP